MKKESTNFDVVILSPHLDDAVLSCGQHILNWKKEGKRVKVITLFTKFVDGKCLPHYTEAYLKSSGFETSEGFEVARIKEDVGVMGEMGVEWEHWGLIDAGFRFEKNKMTNYPTKKKLLGSVIKNVDRKIIKNISNRLKRIHGDMFLLPFGVGGHVDHLIVKLAGQIIKGKKLYYLESPYLWQGNNFLNCLRVLGKTKSFKFGKKEKDIILRKYTSQYELLVNGFFIYPEIVVGV